jgi:hypothetical protein
MMPYPYAVSAELFGVLIDRYPALRGSSETARELRAVAAAALFGTYHQDETGERYLVFAQKWLAALLGHHPKDRKAVAGGLLAQFEAEVTRLNITEYCRRDGKARTIRPEWDPEVLAARGRSIRRDLTGPAPERVDLIEGTRIGARRRAAQLQAYEAGLREELRIEPRHEAYPLCRILNETSPDTRERLYRANWQEALAWYERMPPGIARDGTERVLATIDERRPMIYDAVEKSKRLYVRGPNIHQLPREIRKLLHRGKGTATLDLACSQLAIGSKVWAITPIYDLLATGRSFWRELLEAVGLDDRYKPTVKPATFGALYGQGEVRMYEQLTKPKGGELPLEPEKAERIMAHPLIQVILAQRKAIYAEIAAAGGMADAFGNWIGLRRGRPPHAVAAQALQSIELSLMREVVSVVEQAGDLSVVSFLHDGVTVSCSHRDKLSRRANQLVEAVSRKAIALDIPTRLETTE